MENGEKMLLNTSIARDLSRIDATFGNHPKGTDSYGLWELSERSYRRMATYAIDNRDLTETELAEGLCLAACGSNASGLSNDVISNAVYQHNPQYWKKMAAEIIHFIESHCGR